MGKISLMLCLILVFLVVLVNGQQKKDEIRVFELKKGDFASIKFTNWGASIMSLVIPDNQGKLADVVLGYDSAQSYKTDTTNFGRTLGRVANRIGGAKFTLNGTTYKLVANDGNNTLHGGAIGFNNVLWKVKSYKPNIKTPSITFSYDSFDGEQGFPGKVSVSVTYGIITEFPGNRSTLLMNLAHHTYWNLAGHNSGDILSHNVQIFAKHITPCMPFDFMLAIRLEVGSSSFLGNYDINYVIDEPASKTQDRLIALVSESKSGRWMELWTDQPGVQFYTSNTLSNVKGKGGYVYGKYGALSLETQGFPDAVNHPNFPSVIVNPGEAYIHRMRLHSALSQVKNMQTFNDIMSLIITFWRRFWNYDQELFLLRLSC
ncbi:hypothetical protein MKW92_012306 [Papaver armeniacum]|nr:hypothetical protein MKW92_012306 [Papaver armeniacum]